MNDSLSAVYVLLVFLGMLFALSFERSQIRETYYRFECATDVVNGVCNAEVQAAGQLKVLLLPEQQAVVTAPNGTFPKTHRDCNIYDADNWDCFYVDALSNEKAPFGNFNGMFYGEILNWGVQSKPPRHFYGPAWKWYLVEYFKVPYNQIPF